MASIYPFHPYRYSTSAGPLENLVTQPYDKITGPMRERYLSLSPYNLVRIILGERRADDSADSNVYTRARDYLNEWIEKGILVRESEPGLFAYSQEFRVPDTGEPLVRMGLIGLGAVEDYSESVVHRHEQTLSGPKQDRLELLRHTRAHFGHIFMLYPDRNGEVDAMLRESAAAAPLARVTDEYQTVHALWKICDPERIERIQERMAGRKLVIADGHHRYETALAFRNEHPELADARRVMMTFINMYAPGLRILATHRLVSGLASDRAAFLKKASAAGFRARAVETVEELRRIWAKPVPAHIRIGAAFAGDHELRLLERDRREGDLDVAVLHACLLRDALGISDQAVREERNLRYARGLDTAVEEVRRGAAQIAFLLEPTSVEDVARVALSGGVMPQKSTDFYPKLLSGLTGYKLEK